MNQPATDLGEMAGRQRVLRAIEMRGPDRIPIVFWNRDQAQGDVMLYHLSLGMPGDGSANAWDWSVNEWEDFHEIGVDVLNIAQPNVNDMAEVGRRLRGRQCFMVPISYQTVSIQGTPAEIHAEARRLYDCLAGRQGGFIGYVEEYHVMGMSEENYRACGDAFSRLAWLQHR